MPKILAIDDKEDNLIAISALLKNLIPNSTIATAQSGPEGIEMAVREKPDVILLDIKMPDMDGYEACERLKSNIDTSNIPVIMITAIKTDSESRIKGLNIGADAFISKPIDEAELAAQVNVMLRIKNAEDLLRHEKDLLEDAVSQRTLALQNSEEELRSLSIHLQNVREEERKTIAREIHDELGQILTVLRMDISWLKKRLKNDQSELQEKSNSIIKMIDNAIDAIRKISSDLRPGILDDLGICAAIKWYAREIEKRGDINCSVTCIPDDILLEKHQTITIYRIYQEAMTNIIRHSRASDVSINLNLAGKTLKLEISDNGTGITDKEKNNPKSFGIIGIKERVKSCNGTFSILGKMNEGTRIEVELPVGKEIKNF